MGVERYAPVLDYVVVRSTEPPLTPGGLHILQPDPTAPKYGEVLAVGPGRHSEYSAALLPAPPCKVGDTVLFHGGAGTKVKVDGEETLWMLPRDLMAVVAK